MSRLAGLVLLLSWLQPLHFPPWVSWHHETLAFLGLAALTLGLWCQRAVPSWAVPVTAWPLLALLLLLLVQYLLGQFLFAGDAWVVAFYLLTGIWAQMVAYTWTRAEQLRQPVVGSVPRPGSGASLLGELAWTLLVAAVVSGLIALVQVLDVWDQISWVARAPSPRRPGANLGQPNHLATLLLMGAASLVYLVTTERLSRSMAAVLGALILATLAVTESRTGVLSFVALLAWCAVGRRRAGVSASPWLICLIGLLFFCAYVLWPKYLTWFWGLGLPAQVNTQTGSRLTVWAQLLDAVALNPIEGWGLGQVAVALHAALSLPAHQGTASAPFTYSHNLVLDLLLGIGIPLTLLLLGLSATWLCRRLPRIRTASAWYAMAALIPLSLHALSEYPHAYAYFLIPAMLLLGCLEAVLGAPALMHVTRRMVLPPLLALIALALWMTQEYFRAEEDFRVLRFQALRVGQTPADYVRPQLHVLTQLGALLEAGRLAPQPGMPAVDIELARKVALRFPWLATQGRYALMLALNGQPDEARQMLRVMRSIHGASLDEVKLRQQWQELAQTQYPQLLGFDWP